MTGFQLRDVYCGRREVTDGKFCCKNCPVAAQTIQTISASLICATKMPENLWYGEKIYPRTKFVSSPIDDIPEDLVNTNPYDQAREAQEGLY